MNVKIALCSSSDELFRQYDGEFEAQPCYIELGLQDDVLLASYNANIGNGVPATVRHNIDRRYPIPLLTGEAANRVLQEIAPFAERMLADSKVEWDDNNHVGVLGEDGRAAEEELMTHLGLPTENNGLYSNGSPNQGFDESDLVCVWDTDSSVNGEEVKEYGITAATADKRLNEIEAGIVSDLAGISPSGVAVCPGLHKYLHGLRDDLEAEAEE